MNNPKKQLHTLQDIRPSDTWVDSRWDVLQARLGTEAKKLSFGEKVVCMISHPRLIKPMANGFAAIVVLVMGSWGMIASAQHTTHGDTLYPLKQVIERVSIALTRDDSVRIEKQTAIASTRVRELKSLVVRQELSGDAGNNIDKTVRDLKKELETTQEIFVAAKQSDNKTTLARTAALVEEHTNDLVREITQAREQLSEDVDATVSSDIKAATTLAENTGTEALEVIISNGLGDSAVSEDIIVARLEERVAQVQAQYAEVVTTYEKTIATYQADLDGDVREADTVYEEYIAELGEELDATAAKIQNFDTMFATKDYLGVLQTTLTIKADLSEIVTALLKPVVDEAEADVVSEDDDVSASSEVEDTNQVAGEQVLEDTEATLENKF